MKVSALKQSVIARHTAPKRLPNFPSLQTYVLKPQISLDYADLVDWTAWKLFTVVQKEDCWQMIPVVLNRSQKTKLASSTNAANTSQQIA